MQNSKLLYHGSLESVKKVDLNKCKPWKDFGRGFYLTDDLNQAIKFAKQKKEKSSKENVVPCVSVFKYTYDKNIKVCEFENADEDWFNTIIGFRKQGDDFKLKNFDIVIGKIADDSTRLVLDAALNNTYGDLNDPNVQKFIINLLEVDRLKTQYCFKTEIAIKQLEYVETKFYK